MKARWLLVMLVVPLVEGCPGFGEGTDAPPPDETPTWDMGGAALFMTKCAVCHQDPPLNGAPSGFRFDKYTAADDTIDGGLLGACDKRMRILARAVDNVPSQMPPGGALSAEEKAIVRAWVDADAPRNDMEGCPQ